MLRAIGRRAADERGLALVFAVIFMAVLATGVTTVIIMTTSSQSTASRDTAAQEAFNLAEAGIASAMSALHGTYDPTPGTDSTDDDTPVNALDSTLLPSAASPQTDTYDNGTVTWYGSCHCDSPPYTWTITSTGRVEHGSGPTSPAVTRKLTAVSSVKYDYSQKVNNQIWNYVYSFDPAVSGECEVDLGHSSSNTTLAAPLFVTGNLCLSNNFEITGSGNPDIPVSVVVGGKVDFGSSKTMMGTTSSPIDEAHLQSLANGGGCMGKTGTYHECDPTTNDAGQINIKSGGTFDHVIPDVGDAKLSDPADYDTAYANASPGPMSPCGTGSTGTTPTFESVGNTVRDDSAGTVDLTPSGTSHAYDCIGRDGFGNELGEIKWDGISSLTVNGEIYVDGNIEIGTGNTITYTGQATVYATGYATILGNVCGYAQNGTCSTSTTTGGWDPNTNMLILVAEGQDLNGNSVSFGANNLTWQGGVYAQHDLTLANGTDIEGPQIAGSMTIDNNVTALPFPVITQVPEGAPKNPNVFADAMPPQITS